MSSVPSGYEALMCFKGSVKWLLFYVLVLAAGQTSEYRVDPAKRIPLLTEQNWPEWSWRITAAFAAVAGVAVNVLMYRQSSADVGAPAITDAVRVALAGLRLPVKEKIWPTSKKNVKQLRKQLLRQR
jgi:hypothetical protein